MADHPAKRRRRIDELSDDENEGDETQEWDRDGGDDDDDEDEFGDLGEHSRLGARSTRTAHSQSQAGSQSRNMGIDEDFDDDDDDDASSGAGAGGQGLATLDQLFGQPPSSALRRHRADAPSSTNGGNGLDDMDDVASPEYVAETLLTHGYPDLLEFLNNSLLLVYRRWFPVQPDGTEDSDPSDALRRILDISRLLDARTGQPLISENQGILSRGVLDQIGEDEASITAFSKMLHNHDQASTDPALKKTRLVVSCLTEKTLRILYNARLFHQSMTCMLEDMSPRKLPYTLNFLGEHKFFREMLIFQPIGSFDVKDERAKVVMFLLWQFHQFRWKKKPNSDFIYQEVTCRDPDTGARINTRAYEPKCRIEEAIYSIIQKEQRADLFASIIKRNLVQDIAQFLIKGSFVEFPYISVKETMYSFLDGVWEAETDRFEYYENIEQTFPEIVHQEFVTYKFFKHRFAPVYWSDEDDIPPTPPGTSTRTPAERQFYQSPGSILSELEQPGAGAPDTVMASPARNLRPPRRKLDWREIQNPRFEKIFHDQGWSQRTIDLKYATMGRTLFPAGTYDNCQYIPVDIGESATGKSTAQIIWQSAFLFVDTYIFGAQQEDRFGRDKLPDKRIFLAPDMRGDSFGITPEFFLVLAGNDAGVFPVKFGDPRLVERITTPGMIATNQLPPSFQNDIRGSIFRRLLPFGYTKVISPRNPRLKDEILQHEMPGILRKAVLAYFDPQVHPHDKDLMTDYDFPPEIRIERMKLERASNGLIDFLLSPDYVRLNEPESLVSKAAFVKAYTRFCREIRQQRPANFAEDFYRIPFKHNGLSMEEIDGEIMIRGCHLVQRHAEDDEEM